MSAWIQVSTDGRRYHQALQSTRLVHHEHLWTSSRCYTFLTFIPLWDARLGSRERGCQLEATAMNTLALIRAQILKAQRLHQAQLATVSNPRAQIF